MSDRFDAQEKTEEPTPKALEQARESGNVARSEQLGGAAALLAAALILILFGGAGFLRLESVLVQQFESLPHGPLEFLDGVARLRGIVPIVAGITGPLVLALVVMALSVQWIQTGGPLFVANALQPKPEKLSPLKGLKKMFSLRATVRTGMALARLVLIVAVAVLAVRMRFEELQDLAMLPLEQALSTVAELLLFVMLVVASLLLILALIDYSYQRWQWMRDLRMSKQEVKDEHKNTDGNPEIKKRVRAKRMQVYRSSLREAVSESTVVVTNPTHYAVALRYVDNGATPPVVTAKGVDRIAARIRELARELRIPVIEQPSLARALFREVAIGRAIPERLYLAVAKVLAIVHRLRERRRRRTSATAGRRADA